jgi:hypothetical protein
MSVDRQYGRVVFTCDRCDDSFETPETNFYEALNRIKEEGWFITRDDDDTEWIHICKDCVGEKLPHRRGA